MPNKREQLESALKELDTLAERVRSDESGRAVDETAVKRFDELSEQSTALISELKVDAKRAGSLDEAKNFLASLGANPHTNEEPASYLTDPGKGKSLGEQFTTSKAWREWTSQFPSGVIPDNYKNFHSTPVEFKTVLTGGSATSAGAMVWSDRTGIMDPGTFQRDLTFRDVITVGSTESDLVDYARVTGFTNAAAAVAEAVSSTAGGVGVKPESELLLAKITAAVRTVAHWIPATKRALSDGAQVQTLIDNFLRYGLEEKLENMMISGDGTGENFTGITGISGIQTHAKGVDTLLDAYRKAKTKVRMGGRALPNAYIMNPNDWQEVDLLQNNEGGYYFGGPANPGTPRLWGLPVVECEGVPEGTAYVADFKTLILWLREGASIQVSDSHSDFFVKNLVAILAEMRAAYGAIRPSAIVKITGI